MYVRAGRGNATMSSAHMELELFAPKTSGSGGPPEAEGSPLHSFPFICTHSQLAGCAKTIGWSDLWDMPEPAEGRHL